MEPAAPAPDSTPSLEAVILEMCASAKPGGTINPTDVAEAFAAALGEDELGWRSHLQAVRGAAVRLADAGRLVIFRNGKPADPHDFRGVYRLGAPRSD